MEEFSSHGRDDSGFVPGFQTGLSLAAFTSCTARSFRTSSEPSGMIDGLLSGNSYRIYRKPWFLPSNMGFPATFPIIQVCESMDMRV